MNWIKVRSSLLYFFYVLIMAVLILELILRFIPPISTGNGTGIGKVWLEKNWRPINQQGYRDKEVELNSFKKLIVTVGDSFTAGHGVLANETYAARLRKEFESAYDLVNLGKNGASTLQEHKNFVRFQEEFKKFPDVIVYQYYGNDIVKLAGVKECFNLLKKNVFDEALLKVSYLYAAFYSLVLTKDFSLCYQTNLEKAYHDQSTFNTHKNEILDLLGAMRSEDNRIIFVAFPFLNNDQVLLKSQDIYISDLRKEFINYCHDGDWFYDPSVAAFNIDINNRLASFIDAHPSALLHEVVAKDISRLILDEENGTVVNGAIRCN